MKEERPNLVCKEGFSNILDREIYRLVIELNVVRILTDKQTNNQINKYIDCIKNKQIKLETNNFRFD